MFESLSDRLSSAFRSLSGRAQLTEENIRDGLREVRLALLEADVNFKVVKEFVERVRERVLGQEVEKSLTPTQQLVKAVHDELVTLLGGETTELNLRGAQPGVIMMVGLQGSGKTTSAGKLANLLRKQKMRPYLVPVDVYRPAAIDQLRTLARQLDIPCFASSSDMKPVDIVRAALEDAKEKQCTVVILDTAGRLHIDAPLMQELVDIKSAVQPQEILFVADAMTGQDAVTVAEAFNKDLALTGVVLTKMDGDARGGAALSIKSVSGRIRSNTSASAKSFPILRCFIPNAWRGVSLAWATCSRSSKRRRALSRRKKPKPWPRSCKRPRSILRISAPRCAA